MDSWRASVPDDAQAQLDELFGRAFEAAGHLLAKNGEFFPFGFRAEQDGQVAMFAGDPGLGEHPASLEVLRVLVEGARSQREHLQAVAIAADVTLEGGGDAVRVELEHHLGVALAIHVPYRRTRFTGKVSFGEMSVSGGEPRIWGQ